MNRSLLLLATTVMVALAVLSSGKAPDSTAKPTTPLPIALGVIHPRISLDGQRIAVSYQGAIWTVSREGGVLTRLTDGEGFDHEPAWSPDGQRIAFVRGPGLPAGDLRIIQTSDGKNIPLPKPAQIRGTSNFHKLEFHPDGKRLLGIFRAPPTEQLLAWYDLETGALQSLETPITYGTRYSLSPDGKQIAFVTTMDKPGEQGGNNGPQADVWKMPAAGGPPEKLFRFPSRIYDLCWAADGKSLTVVTELGGAFNDLWQVPFDNPLGGMKKITFGIADEDRPSLSRDGKHLVYIDNRHGPTHLVVREQSTGVEKNVAIESLDFRAPTGRLRLQIRDGDTGKIVTTRVSLKQENGKFVAPAGALYRILRGMGHFYCDGPTEWELPAGKYFLNVFRGPEVTPFHDGLTIKAGQTLDIAVESKRWTHAAKSSWYSGENHIHANYGYGQWFNTPETMLAQCAGEDLNVCNFMVANSDTDGVFDRAFFRGQPDPRSTSEIILYWNQEFRSTLWGHMTLVNLRQVVEPVFTGFQATTNPWDIPTNSDVADRTHFQNGHVNYTHPVQNADKPLETPYAGKGLPVDVALGKIDSMDLNNSYTATVPIWYRFLNCGFRLPPSAGTDCFLNKIFSQVPGADRIYVNAPGPLTYAGWIDGLRKGRSFVSNGPMVELSLNGQNLGDVVAIAGPRKLKLTARVRSPFPLAKVELIYNGQVAATIPLAEGDKSATIDQMLDVDRSGWLALRAAGPGHPDSPVPALFAHTAPIYIEVADAPTRSRADAQFFMTWIDGLSLMARTRDRVPNAEQRQHVLKQLETARAVYARIAK